jgi:GLPGLI family protein
MKINMQKKFIRFISILFTVSISFIRLSAQEGMVRYRYILNVDSTMYRKNIEGIPAFLYFNAHRSLFVFDRIKDSAFAKSAQEPPLQDGAVVSYEEKDEYGNMFYKDFVAGRLAMRRLLFKEAFIAEESLPVVHWNILTDTRKIGGFTCKKAVTNFRGRYYEAWFAPDIPISDGPWKLRGLPGLILEMYDRNKEIQYLFESIKLPYPVDKDITAPKKGSHISFEAFKNIEQTQADKMIKMVKASMDRKDEVDIKVKVFPIEKNYE